MGCSGGVKFLIPVFSFSYCLASYLTLLRAIAMFTLTDIDPFYTFSLTQSRVILDTSMFTLTLSSPNFNTDITIGPLPPTHYIAFVLLS